jgi:hypothetical protein
MRNVTIAVVAVLLLVSPALAWQFITIGSGTSSLPVPLYAPAAIDAGSGPATSVQVKNTGSGTMTVSMHYFDGSSWRATHPRAAALAGEAFYAVSDSVVTLGPDEMFAVEVAAPGSGVHAIYVTRPTATSFKVAYE